MNVFQQKIHIDGKNMMLFGHKALQRVEMLSFDHGAKRQGASYRVRGCAQNQRMGRHNASVEEARSGSKPHRPGGHLRAKWICDFVAA